LADWKLAADNYDQLNRLKTREVDIDGFKVKLQCNPERVRSCAARVDKESIEARPCFLCGTPSEQKSVSYSPSFDILVNPYPIFSKHLTIKSTRHQPQRIKLFFDEMLRLTVDLKDWFVFYNGPQCGASAPDHFHFQAAKSDELPLWKNMKWALRRVICESDETTLYDIVDFPSPTLLIKSTDITEAAILFEQIITLLPKQQDSPEPMMNLLSWTENKVIYCCVFLRETLRPKCFYAENPADNFMISPAAVEMAGLIILPREEDFEKIGKEDIRKVYSDVGYDFKKYSALLKTLKQTL
jgi:hypothetical protein